MRWGAAAALPASMLPERETARPGAPGLASTAEDIGASGVPTALLALRGSTAATSRSTRPTKSATSRHLRDSFASASRLSSIPVSARNAKPLMIAKIASATRSSMRVKPLLRDIRRQPRQHPARVARIAHREVDAPDGGVRRLVHGLVDHEREAALLGIESRRGHGREDAPGAQLRHAVLCRPGREQAMAGLERAVGREARRARGGGQGHGEDGNRDQDLDERESFHLSTTLM